MTARDAPTKIINLPVRGRWESIMTLSHSDAFHLDQNAFRKPLDGNSRTGRECAFEILGVHGIHVSEIGHVSHEHSGLHNIGSSQPGFSQHALNVLEHLGGLFGLALQIGLTKKIQHYEES